MTYAVVDGLEDLVVEETACVGIADRHRLRQVKAGKRLTRVSDVRNEEFGTLGADRAVRNVSAAIVSQVAIVDRSIQVETTGVGEMDLLQDELVAYSDTENVVAAVRFEGIDNHITLTNVCGTAVIWYVVNTKVDVEVDFCLLNRLQLKPQSVR